MERLNLISPIDGRYSLFTKVLEDYFSEYAYIKYRFNVEIDWLEHLTKMKTIFDSNDKSGELKKIKNSFSLDSAKKVKTIEETTNHDVKAIEYFIREELENNNLEDLKHLVHFGLTSEDVNNIAISKMVSDFLNNV